MGRHEADRQSAYQQIFQAGISGNDLAEIGECTDKGWALGGERFSKQIEMLGQRAASKGVGRAEEGEKSCLIPFPCFKRKRAKRSFLSAGRVLTQ